MKILHSLIQGKGPDLLILHGFLGMLDNWKTIGNRLAEDGFRVHLIDQRNHGNSFQSTEFNYRVMAEDLLQYAHHHGLEKFILLGHSMGGKTAMQFAFAHPDKVAKLVVADIAPKEYPPHHSEILRALSTLPLDELQSRADADRHLARFIPEAGVRQFLLKNLYRKPDQHFGLKCHIEVLAKSEEAIGEHFKTDATYTGPVLFLKGALSGYITDEDELSIHRYFPAAQIQTVSQAGHWLHAENPDEFYQYLLAFAKN